MAHTEGPWRVEDRAALVAAAPDMFAACESFVGAIITEYRVPPGADDDYIYDTLGSAMSAAFFEARAALSKAEGR